MINKRKLENYIKITQQRKINQRPVEVIIGDEHIEQ